MQVFLIPLAPGRWEPYTETGDGPVELEGGPPAGGVIRRFWVRFTEMMQAAERAQRERDMADGERSLGGRFADRLLAWVAERIAEQRLLWHLRRHAVAVLVHPSDMTGAHAEDVLRTHLRREAERHRRWLFIDGIITVITGPLFFFVPGPNLVAYYFAFRTVGHFLSGRGARHGLDRVAWSTRACGPLAELGSANGLEPGAREARIRAVAAELQLPHLPTFLERMAVPGA